MNADEFDKIIENVDISGEAPDSEPERQYFFLARAVRVMNEIMGRNNSCYIREFFKINIVIITH